MFKPPMFRQWQDMALFALVAECGSVTQAALKAGMAKSSLSLRISQLEQQLGLRLLNRTTRKISLTFAGERYLIHCQEMMQASERADLAIQHLRDNPSGRLRITSPAGFGATLLVRLTTEFQRRFPAVSLEIAISDTLVDLVDEGFDVAFRTGKPQDSSLIGRPLGRDTALPGGLSALSGAPSCAGPSAAASVSSMYCPSRLGGVVIATRQ